MKKSILPILLILLVGVIIYFVVMESRSSKIENRNRNQFEFSTEAFEKVEDKLINYRETKQIQLSGEPRALKWFNNQIYLLVDSKLKIINSDGKLSNSIALDEDANCIHIIADNTILIGFKSHFIALNSELEQISSSEKENEKAYFTSLTACKEEIFIADAGNRKVLRFKQDGTKISEFEGISGIDSKHGFIIPSAYFDIGVNQKNELWVVNPGIHSFQHYLPSGDLVRYWRKTSVEIDGFSGCCNPAHFTFLPDGNIVTSEKGMPRIKVLDENGELISVVATPEKFAGDQAPDVTCDDKANVYALDYDKRMIRIFEKIEIE